jgi:hypothetical protein
MKQYFVKYRIIEGLCEVGDLIQQGKTGQPWRIRDAEQKKIMNEWITDGIYNKVAMFLCTTDLTVGDANY